MEFEKILSKTKDAINLAGEKTGSFVNQQKVKLDLSIANNELSKLFSRVDYLQNRNNWRAGLSAPQDAHVGHIVEYAPDSARMPVFTLAISGADFTQIVGNPLWAVSLVDILVEYEPDNPGFFLVNFKVI